MISAMLSWVKLYGGSARKAGKVRFCDIEYDIIQKMVISCMISWIFMISKLCKKGRDYNIMYDINTIMYDIMFLVLISYMISYMILSK